MVGYRPRLGLKELGCIVHQPEPIEEAGVEGEHDHWARGDPPHLLARPATGSGHWWMVTMAIEASTAASGRGRAPATALMTLDTAPGRWAIMASEGSTATTRRSPGS